MNEIDCLKCKNFSTDVCSLCSVNRSLECTCFLGHPPCAYCENLAYEPKDKNE